MGGRTIPREVIILRKAKQYITRGYCKGSWTKDKRGSPLDDWDNPRAVSWCLLGAIKKAAMDAKEVPVSAVMAVERMLERQTGNLRSLINWSDLPRVTKEDAIELLDATILHLQEQRAYGSSHHKAVEGVENG